MRYIKKISESFIYPYESPQIGKVELWDFSRANENEEARKEAVCLVASISYGNEFCKNPDKLWNLLIEKGHESPFEFVRQYWRTISPLADSESLRSGNLRREAIEVDYSDFVIPESVKKYIATFKLKVPIFVARQIMRHRSFSYLEMSRRYVKRDKVDFDFWFPKNALTKELFYGVGMVCSTKKLAQIYNFIIEAGYKPEQARAFLPLGLYTQLWMQGDYKAWVNFFIHRLSPEAQEETRLVAKAMWELLKENQPEIIETMTNYLDEWVKDCNPIFIPARKNKAEWFKKEFLGGENEY